MQLNETMKKNTIFALLAVGMLTACDTDNNFQTGEPPWDIVPGTPGGSGSDDSDIPAFDNSIYPYQGQAVCSAKGI